MTDHAVVRYLERVQGVDVAAIRAHLQPDWRTREAINNGNRWKLLHVKKRDCTLRIVDGRVVTVFSER